MCVCCLPILSERGEVGDLQTVSAGLVVQLVNKPPGVLRAVLLHHLRSPKRQHCTMGSIKDKSGFLGRCRRDAGAHLAFDDPSRDGRLPIRTGPEAQGYGPRADVGDDQVGGCAGKF